MCVYVQVSKCACFKLRITQGQASPLDSFVLSGLPLQQLVQTKLEPRVGRNRQPHGWLAASESTHLLVCSPAVSWALCTRRDGPGPVGSHSQSAPRELCNQEVGRQHQWLTRLYKQMACFPFLVQNLQKEKVSHLHYQWERLKVSLWAQSIILLSRCRLLRASNIMVSFKMVPKVLVKIVEDKELPNDFPILTSTNSHKYI